MMEVESIITSNSYPTTRTIEADVVIGLHYDIPTAPPTTIPPPPSATTSSHQHVTHIGETIAELLQSARQDGYKYITCRIPENISMTNMNTSSTINSADDDDYHSLTTMESDDWRTSIVGVMTLPNMTLINTTATTAATTTSIMMMLMTKLKDQLTSSIGWCLHMNIPAIILPSFDTIHSMIRTSTKMTTLQQPSSLDNDEIPSIMMMMIRQYANIVVSCLIHTNVRDLQIWIPHIIMSHQSSNTTSTSNNDSISTLLQYFYQLLDYHPSIRTLYTLSNIMNTKSTTQKQQQQSYGLLQHYIQQIHMDIGSLPPIAAIQIPTTLFNKNVRGFPTLKRIHQQCFIQFYRRFGRNLKLLLTQTIPLHEHARLYSHLHSTQLGATQLLPHYQYIRHLRNSKVEITSVLDGTIVNTTTTSNNDDNSDTMTNKVVSKIRTLELQYNDVLQSPLQPLADHLENYTYEIFEHDPIKYVQYETAIYHTMYDDYIQLLAQYQLKERTSAVPNTIHLDTSTISSSLCSIGSSKDNPPLPLSSMSTNNKKGIVIIPYIVLVVGAGRGPLVTCTMKAYDALLKTLKSTTTNNNDTGFQLKLYIYAVEKNPNAILYLQSKFRQWIHSNTALPKENSSIQLQIVHSDLRYLNADTLFQNIVQQQQSTTVTPTPTTTSVSPPPPPPSVTASYKANLIVSELLGSFGCNELSPECLDTLLHHTNVCSNTMTKSIPYHYTSHVAPISSMQLYQNVKQQALYPTCTHSTQQQMIGLLKAFETPYVVRPYMVSQIYTTQDCWSFTHTPSSSLNTNVSNTTTSVSDIHRDLERYVHLEFGKNDNKNHHHVTTTTQSLPFMYGAQYGTGYGPCDEYVESTMMMEYKKSSKKNSCKSNSSTNTSTDGEQQYHHQSVLEPPQQQSAAWTCTGLLGTFTADLYPSCSHNTNTTNTNESTTTTTSGNIQISTNPDTFSTGMFSWFPLYFPCHQPIQVPKFGVVHIDIWRKCTSTKVWYEWMFTVVVESPSKSNDNSHTTPMATNSDDNDSNIKSDNNINDNNVKMEMDDDRNSTNDHYDRSSTTIHYVSPIHNPGGRSSYVSLLS